MPTIVDTRVAFNIIHTKLYNRIPFALIRCGDGEAIILDKDQNIEQLKQYIFDRQLGKNAITKEQQNEIVHNLIDAYKRADILGLPTEKHDKREDHWGKAKKILSEYININEFVQCSIDLFYNALDDKSLDSLLEDRKVLYYISCRNIDEQLKKRFGIEEIHHFLIQPEMKFTPDYKGKWHYPEQFNEIKEWIRNSKCKGELCLVGAGIVGKIYNVWFKEHGGISLDVGAIFDLWDGRKTRGEGRGANVIDNKYKL